MPLVEIHHLSYRYPQSALALDDVSFAIDGNDLTAAKSALRQTISLIDKMATKGVIHRNAAGRYKSRLTTRIAAKSKAA